MLQIDSFEPVIRRSNPGERLTRDEVQERIRLITCPNCRGLAEVAAVQKVLMDLKEDIRANSKSTKARAKVNVDNRPDNKPESESEPLIDPFD